jgi:hypothetical protein
VPADQTIMQDEATADGTYRIDPAKLWAEAIRLAEGSAGWIIEDDYRISAEHDTDPWAVSRTQTRPPCAAPALTWPVPCQN